MKLVELLDNVNAIQVTGNPEAKEIENITIDSRNVRDNSIFVAISGYKTDGHNYIQEAIRKGAKAIVLENDSALQDEVFTTEQVVKILVPNSRKSLAEISNQFYGEPSKKIKLIGITGTKGKTTTSYYIKNIFDKSRIKSGLIGTNKNLIGQKEIKAELTTPQSNKINELLTEMLVENCTHCVMEISSHALDLHRVDFLDFDVAVYTNITSDHLDYHKTFENYLKAKKIFFDMLKPEAKILYNLDDPNWNELIKDSKAELYSYGLNENSTFCIKNIDYDLNGTRFEIKFQNKVYPIKIGLVGSFNALNAAAAFSAVVTSGIEPFEAVSGIESTPQVPGRFEVIGKGSKKVIIDYSHTADSLRQALTAIKHIVHNDNPIHTVFGCGGDRDKTKRPLMGHIADEMSDKIYVTSDNPRTEDPYKIINDIKKGIKRKAYKVIENREEAIKTAIENSEENAVILIAGKGHETYQEIDGVRSHFSDKEIAEKYLAEFVV